MLAFAGIVLLYIVHKVRVRMTISGVFHNPTYQLGILFGCVAFTFNFGVLIIFRWWLS